MLFRKAVVLIHGFAGGPWDHENLAYELELCSSFDVYDLTLPGHNKSIITNVKRNDWINSVEKLMDKLISDGYRSIYVIGHSMGGVIASHIAYKYKEVKKLVLVAPAFKYLKFKGEKFDIIASLKSVPSLFKGYENKNVIGRIFKSSIPTTLEFMHLVKEHGNDVKNINVPTLIIHGDDDEIVPLEGVEYVFKNLKSRVGILVNISGVTHDVFKSDRGNEVCLLIKKFLKKRYYGLYKVKFEI